MKLEKAENCLVVVKGMRLAFLKERVALTLKTCSDLIFFLLVLVLVFVVAVVCSFI